jgi:GT2 family glycosyltransferase
MIERSFVIPVLDMSPHSRFNIKTLLEDLTAVDGEVICIFNSPEVFMELHNHPRIDKYCYNKLNAGVSRSWNLGIMSAEGRTVFIMNADLHVKPNAVKQLESYLYQLPDAVLVGPQGSYLDFESLRIIHYFQKGAFESPVRTHDVSGFFFVIHLERFLAHKLLFDVRYSPCFMEEWDMAVQVMKAGLCSYAVPVTDWEHEWGISGQRENSPIQYFGRTVMRNDVLMANRHKFREKWFPPSSSKTKTSNTSAAEGHYHAKELLHRTGL